MKSKFKLLIGTALATFGAQAMAGVPPNSAVMVPHSIPAVGQAGLIALAFAVGIIGAVLINRYKLRKH